MNEVIERVARAIYESTWTFDGKSDMPSHGWDGLAESALADRYRQFARAAIEAMREPTGDMKDAGAAAFGLAHTFSLTVTDVRPDIAELLRGALDGQPTKTWSAMIDEALR